MLFGAHAGIVLATQTIDIHGTRMQDVSFQLDGEATPRTARLGAESVPPGLRAGDRVLVHMLMNIASRIELASR